MTHYFLDSSALIKRYIAERGSSWVRAITMSDAGNVIVISDVTRVEVVSGTMRRMREGAISARTVREIRLVTSRHASRSFEVVGLTEQVIDLAQDLLERHALRAYDSIQLASALVSSELLSAAPLPRFTFVAADRRVLAVAASEGLIVVNPDDY